MRRRQQQIFQHREPAQFADDLKGPDQAERRDAVHRQRADDSALRTSPMPISALTRPEMTLSSVVLPAPFGPMMPVTVPLRKRQRTAVERGDAAEMLADIIEHPDSPSFEFRAA